MNQKDLVSYLIAKSALKTPNIIAAFSAIDRKDFVLPDYLESAYLDRPLGIGHDQTISQPTVVAMMLEWLQPNPGESILDVGSGSGWTTALLAECVGPKGRVVGLERISELVRFGQANLKKYGLAQAEIRQVRNDLGLPEETFDRILVSAAASNVPKTLLTQLKINGVLVIPIENAIHKITRRSATKFEESISYGFTFVPLIEG